MLCCIFILNELQSGDLSNSNQFICNLMDLSIGTWIPMKFSDKRQSFNFYVRFFQNLLFFVQSKCEQTPLDWTHVCMTWAHLHMNWCVFWLHLFTLSFRVISFGQRHKTDRHQHQTIATQSTQLLAQIWFLIFNFFFGFLPYNRSLQHTYG